MAGRTLNIRAARHEDVDACFALFGEVQEFHAAERPDIFRPPELNNDFRRLVADAIDAERKGILLAWHETRAVGLLIYEFTRLDPTGVYLIDRPILWIESIAVASAYRGKGCGKAMLDLARHIAAEHGVETLALEAWVFNGAARAWFERQGFAAHSATMMAKVDG